MDELRAGRVAAAEARLGEFERLLDVSEYARCRYVNRYQLVRSELSLASGDLEAAGHFADAAAELANEKGMRKNLVRSWLLSGRTLLARGHPQQAAELLRRAVAVADEMEHGSLRWQGRLWLGGALTALRQSAAAADVYRQALDRVTAIAGELDDERLRAAFLTSHLVQEVRNAASAVERPTEPTYPAGLTAREVEVLRLVAQGATNLAVAEALTISVKTVNAHLSSILGKTASPNRAAAAAFALRHRLV